jgi:chromate transporter
MLGIVGLGVSEAFMAVAGIFFFPSIILILIAIFFEHVRDIAMVAGALKGMGATSAGLIAGSSIKLAKGLKSHPLTLPGALVFSFSRANGHRAFTSKVNYSDDIAGAI